MSREIMQRSLATFKVLDEGGGLGYENHALIRRQIETLEEALAKPKQEPVAYLCKNAVGYKFFRKKKPDNVYKPIALYAAPVKRPWLGLTSEDWENTPDTGKQGCERDAELFDWIEQTLKDKNDVI